MGIIPAGLQGAARCALAAMAMVALLQLFNTYRAVEVVERATEAVSPPPVPPSDLAGSTIHRLQADGFPPPPMPAKPQSSPQSQPSPPVTIVVAASEQGEGLDIENEIQQLKTGGVPHIEIAWPDETGAKSQLQQFFRQCIGMEYAGLSDHGLRRLTTANHELSPLIRLLNGRLSTDEILLSRRLRGRERLVRLMPLRFDARLLAGLSALSDQPLVKESRVSGYYQLLGQRLLIHNIRLDGQAVEGQIMLINGRHDCAV